jgi:hypothetical protein
VNPDERQLLELTARMISPTASPELRLSCNKFLRSGVGSKHALARLRIKADLLKLKGKPCAYLESFVRDFSK